MQVPRGAARPSPVPRPRPRPAWALPLVVASLFAGAIPAAAQTSSDPPALPICEEVSATVGDCLLPRWPQDGAAGLPSLFGELDPERGVWVADAAADPPPGALGIRALGVTRVRVADVAAVRESPELLRKGGKKKAVPNREGILVRVVLDRPLDAVDAIDTTHAGVFVVTDVDGVRSNNAPLGVAAPDGPFADFQHVYSLNAAVGRDGLAVLHTDLSKRRWYRGNNTFAAARPAPEVIDMLIAPQSFGDSVRVVTYVEGADAGSGAYAVAGLGPTRAAIPLDGRVGMLPRCVEGSISNQAFIVRRLVENGQTFRGIETPRSWKAAATFLPSEDERGAIEALMALTEAGTQGALGVLASAVLIDEGLNVRQSPILELRLVGPDVYLGFELGLARRGYHVLRDIEPEPTGDVVVDAFLGRATDALVATMPPFRSTNREGPLLGGGAGSCLPADPGGSTEPGGAIDPGGTT